jgi:ribonuclease P protein component
VRRKSEFDAVYRRGQRLSDPLFTLNYLPNTLGTARLGLAIAARTAGIAVERNRIRRVIRESFRQARPMLPEADIVIGARPPVRDAANAALRTSLDALWVRLGKACAPSSKA